MRRWRRKGTKFSSLRRESWASVTINLDLYISGGILILGHTTLLNSRHIGIIQTSMRYWTRRSVADFDHDRCVLEDGRAKMARVISGRGCRERHDGKDAGQVPARHDQPRGSAVTPRSRRS